MAEEYNSKRDVTVPVVQSDGYTLAKSYGKLKAGHEILTEDIKYLIGQGVTDVAVKRERLKHSPMFMGIRNLPITQKNWLGQMGYQEITKSITQGASEGWKSDLHNYHPVPAFAYGAEFGEGSGGKY